MKLIGVMSGTSIDGLDVALLRVDSTGRAGDGPPFDTAIEWELLGFHSVPYTDERRERIRSTIVGGGAAEVCALHADLGEWMAEAVLDLLDSCGAPPSSVDAIGAHGHTLWHRPPTSERRGATLQVGDPATLAERTGIPVVSDLRSRDVAAGGHGAPLVPFVDRLLFSGPEPRVLQNLGGIGNLTWVPPRGEGALVAFDTGPANGLMNVAAALATDGELAYDRDGRMGAAGTVDVGLLNELLADPFFSEAPPRSTGPERFGPELVGRIVAERGVSTRQQWCDLIATFAELTAHSIGLSLRTWIAPRGDGELFLFGGGARNPFLVERIRRAAAPWPIRDGGELGMDPDAKEAAAFAVLAWAHLEGVPGNEPEATGARASRVLGSWTPGGTWGHHPRPEADP